MLEAPPNQPAIERVKPLDGGDGLVPIADDEARHSVLDDLRHRAVRISDRRRAASHRLDHRQPEGLGPVDRQQRPQGAAEQALLVPVADFSEELDVRLGEHRPNHRLEVLSIYRVHLRRDLQRNAGFPRDPDGAIRPFLRADSTEEHDIAFVPVRQLEVADRIAVVNVADPIQPRQRPALR